MAKYYVLDEGKNFVEGMSKEQTLAAIVQAVEQGTIKELDKGFISSLKEQNAQKSIKLWIGTTSEYESLSEKDSNTLYIVSNDTTLDDIEKAITGCEEEISNILISIKDISYFIDTVRDAETGFIDSESVYFPHLGENLEEFVDGQTDKIDNLRDDVDDLTTNFNELEKTYTNDIKTINQSISSLGKATKLTVDSGAGGIVPHNAGLYSISLKYNAGDFKIITVMMSIFDLSESTYTFFQYNNGTEFEDFTGRLSYEANDGIITSNVCEIIEARLIIKY